jgi:hypothetical protein
MKKPSPTDLLAVIKMSDETPSQEELIAAWQESLARKKGLGQFANAPDLQAQGNSAIHGKPTQSYSELKAEFDRRRGVSKGWEVEDTTEHDISNKQSPQTGHLRDHDTGNFIDYQTAKRLFYAKMGRQTNEDRQAQMDLKNEERRKKYISIN